MFNRGGGHFHQSSTFDIRQEGWSCEIITLPSAFHNTNHWTFFHLLVTWPTRSLSSHSDFIYLFSIETVMNFPLLSHGFCHAHCSPFSLHTMDTSSNQVVFSFILSVFTHRTAADWMLCNLLHDKAGESSHIWDTWTGEFGSDFKPVRPEDLNSW